ncbi:MAG: glycosyltransferase [Spirochaetales bacterium]|nr:glycosyltransferase [Spirochaetales bacterium]
MPNKKKGVESKGAEGSTGGRARDRNELLFEISWEVCNQIGGIYSVLRSKAPVMVERWGERYTLLGPYFEQPALSEFEIESGGDDEISRCLARLNRSGLEAYLGRWLVTGNPRAVLFNVFSVYDKLAEIRREFWQRWGIDIPQNDDLMNQAFAFGYCLRRFFNELYAGRGTGRITAHFHEWLSGAAVELLRSDRLPMGIVFTTHATLLGRYIATNDEGFSERLPRLDWEREARQYAIEARVSLERSAALHAHCFTTVSEVTARECVQFLGRKPDIITPNGLNIERFAALHEFQNLHREYKEKITQFVMGHFFPSYSFDLDKTIFCFTSGRFEYRNKGFDVTLEALSRLNQRMKTAGSPVTIVMFFITKRPFYSMNPTVMHERALVEELRHTCNAMLKQVQERLIYEVAARQEHTLPPLNTFIDDYWILRLKRTLASFKTDRLPIVVTHNLVDDAHDEILEFLRRTRLVNGEADRVKIVYHPDFITPTNPLFGLEYGQFVRGCHLGIFPSSYEPWGYTPLECVANGVPAVTSDLSGFGDYVMRSMPDHDESGIWVVRRRGRSFNDAAEELAGRLQAFVELTRRERIAQRNAVENRSSAFDWHNLVDFYVQAYDKAEARLDNSP